MSAAAAHQRAVLAYVAAIGGAGGHVERRARGAHPRVHFAFAGRERSVVIGSTPSDRNAIWLARRYIRRAAGLASGLERERTIGLRRPGRTTHDGRRPPERLVQLAAPLPDWHDALRRHPLYRAPAPEAAA